MPVGMHSVFVYPDRSAGDWSDPICSNPYFTLGLQGWSAGPFAQALTWIPDGRIQGYPSRDPAFPCPTPMTARTFRTRATISIRQPAAVFVKVTFGKEPGDAWAGPFWRPGTSQEIWNAWVLPAGTHQVTSTWGAPVWMADYPYIGVSLGAQLEDGSANLPYEDFVADTLVLDYLSSGGEDISCLIDQVSINHGRDDSTSQPEAASATLDFTATPLDPLPAVVEVGAVVVASTTTATSSSQRFVGRITDMSLGWDDAGELTPDAGVGQLVCASVMADLGRRVVGDVPWPDELDGSRVSRIMTAAAVELDPAWSDPGTVQILGRDVDSQPALDLAQEVAQDAGGILWHTRDGDIRYADADHRRGIAPSLEVDACDVLVTPTWRRTTEGLVNQVSIGYGAEPEEGGEQPRVASSDPVSIARFGRYFYTAATQLAAEADAQALANLLMVRNTTPVWVMAALPVDTEGLTEDEYNALLSLDMHSLIRLTGMPAIGTAPTSAVLWVEGWKEVLAYGKHELELVVSGYCRTAPPPRWDDLNPEWTWDTVASTLTWNDTTCLGPPVDRGRWADVPASLRWSQVPPDMTWDTVAPMTTTARERELSHA